MTKPIKGWPLLCIFFLLSSTTHAVRGLHHSKTEVCIRNRLPQNSPPLWAECRNSDNHMELGNQTIPLNGEIKWQFPSSDDPHNFCLFGWDGKQQIIGVGGRETVCSGKEDITCLWAVKKDGLYFQTANGLEKECDWQDLDCLA